MKQEEQSVVLELDDFEQRVMIHALNDLRNDLLEEKKDTEPVDDLLLKTIDAPASKRPKRRDEGKER